jgi:anti-sigma-K factor RskA
MSFGEQSDEDNALAGEYALGVLSAAERRAVERRMAADAGFADLVASWQSDLSALDDAYAPETAPEGLKARIDAQLFDDARRPATGLWGSLVFWRGLAFAGVAAAIALGLFSFDFAGLRTITDKPPALVAELGAPGSSVGLVAALDPASGQLQITPAAFSPDDGKVLELWLVPGEGVPVSLGLVPADGGRLVLEPDLTAQLSTGAVIAVSVEPEGGSPVGAPTGPVVLSGALVRK